MATKKKDLLEQENQAPEILEKSAQTDETAVPAPNMEEADNLSAGNGDGSDAELNELLISMDQELPGENALPNSDLPEFSEELNREMDGEHITATDDSHDADASDSTVATGSGKNDSEAEEPATVEVPPAKPKRTTRKRKTPEPETSDSENVESENTGPEPSISESSEAESNFAKSEDFNSDTSKQTPIRSNAPVLTIRSREDVTTESEQEDITWHEIRNAYRTRRILTGKLGGIEQTDNHKTIAIVDYKGFRIIIPLKEMMFQLPRTNSEQEYSEMMLRQNKILNNMLGADIDFIVRGIHSKTYSVVASRREAMLRKRQLFYLDTDPSGACRIYEGRLVQARVIAVAEKVIRVEVFGVETSIMARDLAWDWIGDAHERFSVGDEVLVLVQKVRRDSLEELGIRVDIKSISQNTSQDNLQKCRIQSKYMGKVTDVHKGVVYIRLSNGVNAIAHSCYDYRTPGKKDDVSFAVTRLDVERGVAVGIITRIIRQNL